MKALENIDLKKDDDVYNYIFAEGSSEDDDFEVSKSNSLNEDSFDSDFYQQESISEFEDGDEDQARKKSINSKKLKKTNDIIRNENNKKFRAKVKLGINKNAQISKKQNENLLNNSINKIINNNTNNNNINPYESHNKFTNNTNNDNSNLIANEKNNIFNYPDENKNIQNQNLNNINNFLSEEKNHDINLNNNSNIENNKNIKNDSDLKNNYNNNVDQEEDKPKKGRLGVRSKKLGKSNLNFLLKEPEPSANEEAILLGLKRRRRETPAEDFVDLDMLDIDQIDEAENMDDEEIESSENDSESKSISENSEEFIPKIVEKKQKINESKKFDETNNFIKNQEDIQLEEEQLASSNEEFQLGSKKVINKKIESEPAASDSEKENKFKFKSKPKEKQQKIRYRKNFIDYDEDEDFIKQKKKQREILNKGKKQNLTKSKAKATPVDSLEKEGSANENVGNNIIKLENFEEKNNFSATQNTAKAVYNGNTYRKLINLNDQVYANQFDKDNVFISDFNIVIKKSYLNNFNEFDNDDETKEDNDIEAFMLGYTNPEILHSDHDKIIIRKSILKQHNNLEPYNTFLNQNNIVTSNDYSNNTNLKNQQINKATKKENLKKQPKIAKNKLSEITANNQLIKRKQSDLYSEQPSSALRKKSFSIQEESNKDTSNMQDDNNFNNSNLDENENYNENLNEENDEDYSESDLMKYNDRNFRRKQKQFDEDFIVGQQKKAAPKPAPQAPVKLSYQEKLSQKDLLYEAIFTELYNIKSLEDMQRLEELNKRDVNYSSKKQFVEFIKVKRKVIKKNQNQNENIHLEINKDEKQLINVLEKKTNNKIDIEINDGIIGIDNDQSIKVNALDEMHKENEEELKEEVDIDELIRKKMLEKDQESGNQLIKIKNF